MYMHGYKCTHTHSERDSEGKIGGRGRGEEQERGGMEGRLEDSSNNDSYSHPLQAKEADGDKGRPPSAKPAKLRPKSALVIPGAITTAQPSLIDRILEAQKVCARVSRLGHALLTSPGVRAHQGMNSLWPPFSIIPCMISSETLFFSDPAKRRTLVAISWSKYPIYNFSMLYKPFLCFTNLSTSPSDLTCHSANSTFCSCDCECILNESCTAQNSTQGWNGQYQTGA
jgi:hypothetical protein